MQEVGVKSMFHLCRNIFWFIQDLFNLLRIKKIFVCGFYKRTIFGHRNNNWGDDINISFIKEITGCEVLDVSNSWLYKQIGIRHFSCIGSIIGDLTDEQSVIWGSGLISANTIVANCPKKICSVRGPLTRQVLLSKGIDCPQKFGDPAMLISLFYKPSVEKKYNLGIIAHYVDEENPSLVQFVADKDDVLVISMSNYERWQDIPDKICSCKKVLSSSLHGLIVSDTYGVPNCWAKFSDDIAGGDFKYYDYFGSVDRNNISAKRIRNTIDLENLQESDFSVASHIDYQSILEVCPFKHLINC